MIKCGIIVEMAERAPTIEEIEAQIKKRVTEHAAELKWLRGLLKTAKAKRGAAANVNMVPAGATRKRRVVTPNTGLIIEEPRVRTQTSTGKRTMAEKAAKAEEKAAKAEEKAAKVARAAEVAELGHVVAGEIRENNELHNRSISLGRRGGILRPLNRAPPPHPNNYPPIVIPKKRRGD